MEDVKNLSGTLEKGKLAEDIACRWLESKGLVIVERNWRHHHLEIDIIAEGPLLEPDGKIRPSANGVSVPDSFIHIVEVRSRSSSFVEPEETVDMKKQRHIVCAADAYIRRSRTRKEVVFDIMGVVFLENGFRTAFYPDAFRPLW